MGIAAPLICYQVANKVQTIAKTDLDQLKAVAAILDKNVPASSADFSDEFSGDRSKYVFRDASGNIKAYLEKGALLRPTLLGLLRKVSPEFCAVLVPDIDDFLDCDPYLAATLAAMNGNHGLQILSLRIRIKDRPMERVALTPEKLLKAGRGRDLKQLLYANSRACQKKSEVKLGRIATTDEAHVRSIRELDLWQTNNQQLLALLVEQDEVFSAGEPLMDPIFERVRKRAATPAL